MTNEAQRQIAPRDSEHKSIKNHTRCQHTWKGRRKVYKMKKPAGRRWAHSLSHDAYLQYRPIVSVAITFTSRLFELTHVYPLCLSACRECTHAHQRRRHNPTVCSGSASARASPPEIRSLCLPETTSPQARDPKLRALHSMPRAPAGSAFTHACVGCHSCFVLLQVPGLCRPCSDVVFGFFHGVRLAKARIDRTATGNFRGRPV